MPANARARSAEEISHWAGKATWNGQLQQPSTRTQQAEAGGTCFAFDLDGTITTSELLPLIASELGLEAEMRLLTQLTMDGVIPFEDSFRLRFAILRTADYRRIQEIAASVKVDPDIREFIRNNRDRCFVITGNLDIWIKPLLDQLGCGYFTSTAIVRDGRVAGIERVMRKNIPCLDLKERFSRVVAIGDGFNDLPMFDVADIGIAFNGVHRAPDPLVSAANYVALNGKSLCRLLNTL